MTTTIENKTKILAEVWLDYRDDERFDDFCEYNDVGLPLAYFISSGIVPITPKAEMYIDETFYILMAAFNIEDTGFETFTDVMNAEAQANPGI